MTKRQTRICQSEPEWKKKVNKGTLWMIQIRHGILKGNETSQPIRQTLEHFCGVSGCPEPRIWILATREGATAATAGLARFGAIGAMTARCSEAMHSTKPFHALAYLCHLCRGAWADSRSQQTAGCTGSCQGLLSLDRQQICGIHTVFISAVKVRSASLCPRAGLATWTGSRGALFDWRADERTWCIATRANEDKFPHP